MNKLEIGMYVRTKCGIGKIDKTRYFLGRYEFHLDSNKGTIHNVTDNTYWNTEHNIIGEPSLNQIDLIEVGDYANGCKVIKNTLKDGGNIVIVQGGNCFTNDDIKTVVTKEQFSAMEYRLGDK